MTHNFGRPATMEVDLPVEAPHVEGARETLDRLRQEAAELRASRERLVLAADADRRSIEGDLHEGVQQQLVALAVNLQLAGVLADADPAAAKALMQEMARDVELALDEATQLAERIYPPLLQAGSLAAALRSVASAAGVRAHVDIATGTSYPPEVMVTVYLCWVAVLEHAGAGARATIALRDEGGALAFEVMGDGACSDSRLDPLRDRVEALAGRLTIQSEPGARTLLVGSLPLSG
jgi:signal transduction histidine kinase